MNRRSPAARGRILGSAPAIPGRTDVTTGRPAMVGIAGTAAEPGRQGCRTNAGLRCGRSPAAADRSLPDGTVRCRHSDMPRARRFPVRAARGVRSTDGGRSGTLKPGRTLSVMEQTPRDTGSARPRPRVPGPRETGGRPGSRRGRHDDGPVIPSDRARMQRPSPLARNRDWGPHHLPAHGCTVRHHHRSPPGRPGRMRSARPRPAAMLRPAASPARPPSMRIPIHCKTPAGMRSIAPNARLTAR